MFDELTTAGETWKEALAGLEPDSMVGGQPAKALAVLREVERATAAARLAVTARAERMHPWQREGYKSFEEWLAAQEGTSTGAARRRSRTARKLRKGSGRTAEALQKGRISEDEADVIADATDKNPGAEQRLLDTAEHEGRSHADLRDEAAKAKAAGEDDADRAQRLREGRTARRGRDRDGFWTAFVKLQPEVGAQVQAAWDAEFDRQFAANRTAGTREPLDRHRADALAAVILGRAGGAAGADPAGPAADGPAPATTALHKNLVLDINVQTYRRGRVLDGETCAIRGVGPVPVEVAREWLADAFVKAVIRDGTDVRLVAHYGRHVPAKVRTALEISESACAVPGCSNMRVEYDHDRPYADGGACSTANLRALCGAHHRQRTHDGYELRGPPGDRRWLDPDGTVLFADEPTVPTTERVVG